MMANPPRTAAAEASLPEAEAVAAKVDEYIRFLAHHADADHCRMLERELLALLERAPQLFSDDDLLKLARVKGWVTNAFETEDEHGGYVHVEASSYDPVYLRERVERELKDSRDHVRGVFGVLEHRSEKIARERAEVRGMLLGVAMAVPPIVLLVLTGVGFMSRWNATLVNALAVATVIAAVAWFYLRSKR